MNAVALSATWSGFSGPLRLKQSLNELSRADLVSICGKHVHSRVNSQKPWQWWSHGRRFSSTNQGLSGSMGSSSRVYCVDVSVYIPKEQKTRLAGLAGLPPSQIGLIVIWSCWVLSGIQWLTDLFADGFQICCFRLRSRAWVFVCQVPCWTWSGRWMSNRWLLRCLPGRAGRGERIGYVLPQRTHNIGPIYNWVQSVRGETRMNWQKQNGYNLL